MQLFDVIDHVSSGNEIISMMSKGTTRQDSLCFGQLFRREYSRLGEVVEKGDCQMAIQVWDQSLMISEMTLVGHVGSLG